MGSRRCPYTPGTFRAMRWADGPIWISCRACRRYIELAMTTDVAERQVKRTRFTCSSCGGPGAIMDDDPATLGYTLDPKDNARRRPAEKRQQPRPEPPLPPYGRPTF